LPLLPRLLVRALPNLAGVKRPRGLHGYQAEKSGQPLPVEAKAHWTFGPLCSTAWLAADVDQRRGGYMTGGLGEYSWSRSRGSQAGRAGPWHLGDGPGCRPAEGEGEGRGCRASAPSPTRSEFSGQTTYPSR
jgi:hypothetical protein